MICDYCGKFYDGTSSDVDPDKYVLDSCAECRAKLMRGESLQNDTNSLINYKIQRELEKQLEMYNKLDKEAVLAGLKQLNGG